MSVHVLSRVEVRAALVARYRESGGAARERIGREIARLDAEGGGSSARRVQIQPRRGVTVERLRAAAGERSDDA